MQPVPARGPSLPVIGAIVASLLFTPSVPARERRLELSLVTTSLPPSINGEEARGALKDAAAAWSYPAISCSSLIVTVGPPANGRLVEPDGVSKIFFRARKWCHNERCGGLRTFPLAAAAMTTRHGTSPLEADIEINAVSYAWSEREAQTNKRHASLRAVFAHEIGHALGLEDACAGRHGRPLKGDCAETDTIMLASASFNVPQALDIRRVCMMFPRASQQSASTERDDAPRAWRVLLPWILIATTLLIIHVRGSA